MPQSFLQPRCSTDPDVLAIAGVMTRVPWRARGRPIDLWAALFGITHDMAAAALAHLMTTGQCTERGGTHRPLTYTVTRSTK